MNIPNNWIYIALGFAGLLILLIAILVIILFLLSKNTHAFAEWKAKRAGIPLCIFFNDDNTAEWKAVKPEAGIINDRKYGSYIVNPQSNYLDRTSKVVLIPVSSSVGVTVPASFAQTADALSKIVQDPKKFQELRKRIMKEDGKVSKSISFLKETVNFSSIKRMLNSISPHNIDAKINLMVSRKIGNGMLVTPQSILVFVLLGLGLIALFAFVYNGKQGQVVVQQVSESIVRNATQPKIIS